MLARGRVLASAGAVGACAAASLLARRAAASAAAASAAAASPAPSLAPSPPSSPSSAAVLPSAASAASVLLSSASSSSVGVSAASLSTPVPFDPVVRTCQFQFKAFDHAIVDGAAQQLRRIAVSLGLEPSGIVSLPQEVRRLTLLRSPHVHKRAQDHFEQRTHKKLVEIKVRQSRQQTVLHLIDRMRRFLPGMCGMRIRTTEIAPPRMPDLS